MTDRPSHAYDLGRVTDLHDAGARGRCKRVRSADFAVGVPSPGAIPKSCFTCLDQA